MAAATPIRNVVWRMVMSYQTPYQKSHYVLGTVNTDEIQPSNDKTAIVDFPNFQHDIMIVPIKATDKLLQVNFQTGLLTFSIGYLTSWA